MPLTASHAQVYLRRAVSTWVLGVTDWSVHEPDPTKVPRRVFWLHQARRAGAQRTVPRPKLPYIGLALIGKLTPLGRGENRPFIEQLPTSVTLTVSAPSIGDTAAMRVGYQEVRHVRGALESESDVRDRLLDQIQAGVEPVDSAAVGATQINLTRRAGKSGLLDVTTYPNLGVTQVIDTTEPGRLAVRLTMRARVRLNFYGFDATDSTYNDVQTAVDTQFGRDILASFGAGIQSERPGGVDISNDTAGAFEGRESLDIRFAVAQQRYRTGTVPIESTVFTAEYLRAPNQLA